MHSPSIQNELSHTAFESGRGQECMLVHTVDINPVRSIRSIRVRADLDHLLHTRAASQQHDLSEHSG